ncbi:hypothetical protein DLM78_08110 [Leptospira stimsonii]|uniref:Uncharacterized protein n=1 Tax=Leptospira stimsonii TaxID=2202203 RepID=A0A8B3CW71_9LEPT|nr:hypothetical protein DLM78_08110 [Leptospira stimsonii]
MRLLEIFSNILEFLLFKKKKSVVHPLIHLEGIPLTLIVKIPNIQGRTLRNKLSNCPFSPS